MYEYMRKVQYYETDQMGYVHHSNHVRWMEEARVEFFDYKSIEDMGIISPVINVNVDYKKPVKFGDEVRIGVFVKEYDGIKLTLGYEFLNITKNEVSAFAVSKHCFLKNNKLISLKKDAKEVHEMLLKNME